jgi:hypothetical protein
MAIVFESLLFAPFCDAALFPLNALLQRKGNFSTFRLFDILEAQILTVDLLLLPSGPSSSGSLSIVGRKGISLRTVDSLSV